MLLDYQKVLLDPYFHYLQIFVNPTLRNLVAEIAPWSNCDYVELRLKNTELTKKSHSCCFLCVSGMEEHECFTPYARNTLGLHTGTKCKKMAFPRRFQVCYVFPAYNLSENRSPTLFSTGESIFGVYFSQKLV